MQSFILLCLISAAVAGRLENTYLPPSGAPNAGGSGSFISTPFRSSSGAGFGGSAFGSASSAFRSAAPAPAPAGQYSSAHSSGPQIGIVRYDNDNDGLGHYSYAYETQNHISAQETGNANEASSVQGSYSYTGPDGVAITVNYIADENGFQPSGAHLPTPPPIPEAILKSLQYNAANPSSEQDDGQYQSQSQYQSQPQYQSQSQYQAPSANRQYLAPNKPSFNSQSGYRY